jgi:YVTN family beta-propeller protein
MRRGLLAAAIGTAVVVSGCGAGDESAPPSAGSSGSSSSSTSTSQSSAPYVVARVPTGAQPCGILGVDDAVWVSNFRDDTLVSVDPATGTVSDPVPTGDEPCGLAVGAGSIWVEDYGSDEVTRVSVADRTVQATYKVGSQPYDVTFAGGAAWVTNYGSGSVSRIDAATGKVTEIETGGSPIGIAPAQGKVWVGAGAQGVVAIDTRTSKVAVTIDTDGQAGWTAYDEGHVWVNVDDTVVEVDAGTGAVVSTVQVGQTPEDGTVVGGDVWVGDKSGDLYRFPVGGGTATTVPSTVGNPFVAAELDGELWVVDFAGTDVVRIDPGLAG